MTISRRHFLRLTGSALLAMGSSNLISGCALHKPHKKKLRFVFYTDVHARTEWDTPTAMARAAEAINAQQVDFVITGGDLITDGFQNSASFVAPRWDAYMTMHKAINTKVYSTIGNHDLVAARPEDGTSPAADPRAIYREKLGLDRTYYSFHVNGYHFFVLDSIQISNDKYKYHGYISTEQMEWLKQELSKIPADTPVILVSHIPLLTAFYNATEGATFSAQPNRVVTNNVEVLKIFQKHNLILVLQGHLHIKERLFWRNTTFITGGAVCAKWWRGPWHGTREGFNVITLDGNKIDWDYIEYGWQSKRPPRK